MNDTKVAWVVGGAGGIGLGAAKMLARKGWMTVISDRSPDQLQGALKELQEAGRAESIALDVTSAGSVTSAANSIASRHRKIDLLVNCAGLNVPNRGWSEMTHESWNSVVRVNLDGLLYCMHAVLPIMRARNSGTIINLASSAGRSVTRMAGPAYNASKTAVVTLTHSFNLEQTEHGLRACAICPSVVATDFMKHRATMPNEDFLSKSLRVEDIVRAIEFVAEAPPNVCISEIAIGSTFLKQS